MGSSSVTTFNPFSIKFNLARGASKARSAPCPPESIPPYASSEDEKVSDKFLKYCNPHNPSNVVHQLVH